METRQISPLLAAAIFALATSLTFISSCNSDDQAENTPNTVADTGQTIPNTLKREKKSIKIKFKIKDEADGLEIEEQDIDDCESYGRGIGCFKIDKGKTGLVEFTFNTNSSWKLTQLTICRGETKEKCSPNLSYEERTEFFVLDKPESTGGTILTLNSMGRIDLTALPDGNKAFFLYDKNTFLQTYYYNIEVCNDDGKCLTLDPPLENKG